MQSCAKSWGVFLAKSVNPGAPRRHLSDKSRVVWKLQCKIRNSCASLTTSARALRTSATVSSRQIERILPRHDDFAERHIGPGEKEKRDMLDVLGLEVRFTSLFPSLYEMGAKKTLLSFSLRQVSAQKHLHWVACLCHWVAVYAPLFIKLPLFPTVSRPVDWKHSTIFYPSAEELEDGWSSL